MGFLKKIGKGLRKAFKKIGQGIKKAFKKFGKFMGKIGILGQLAMMFILPGIGGALLKGFGAMAGNMASLTGRFAGLSGGALGTVVKGVGTVLKGAHGFVQAGVNAYKTVTSGIMEFGKTALNKIPGINISSAKANFFGKEGVFEGIKLDAKRIFDPFKSNITVGKGMTLESMSKTTGLSESTLQRLNPDMDFTNLQQGTRINLDFNQTAITKSNISAQLNDSMARNMQQISGTQPGDFDLSIDPETSKVSLNYDVGAVDTVQMQQQTLGYDMQGYGSPIEGQFYGDVRTAQMPKIDILEAIKAPAEKVTGISPATGETFVDPTYKPPSLFDLPESSFDASGFSRTDLVGEASSFTAPSLDSLLSPQASTSRVGKFFQGTKQRLGFTGDTFGENVSSFAGKIGDSFVNTSVQALTDRAVYGSPEDPDYGSVGGGVEYALPYQQITPATPLNEMGNAIAGLNPYGSSAAMNDALGILMMDMGGARLARGMA
tara:strand:+ start:1601 stop:3070 length:1470 start_codon:yes stop_codon:yes gene_type:complete